MPTLKQEKLADKIIEAQLENKDTTLTEILIEAGYSPETARAQQKNIIERPGVQQALAEKKQTMVEALEAVGVTPTKVSETIGTLIENRDYRAKVHGVDFALKLGVGGGYSPTKSVHIHADLKDTDDYKKAKEIAEKYEAELLQGMTE